MSKAERFIQLNTKTYSNETRITIGRHSHWEKQPWLTPEQALRAVEIARKEVIEGACKWLKENKDHPFIKCEDPCLSGYLTDEFIEDFKQAMEEEL